MHAINGNNERGTRRMKRVSNSLTGALLHLLAGALAFGQPNEGRPVIPDRWVREAFEAVRADDTTAMQHLTDEFHMLENPEDANNAGPLDLGMWSIFQILAADLDNDGRVECLVTFDGRDYPYVFTVLRKRLDKWELLYREGFWSHETAFRPIHIVHTNQPARTLFYREDVSPSGGGRDYHYSSYSILSLVGDSVRTVVQIDGSSMVWRSSLSYLNASVDAVLDLWSDGITATYRYTLYAAVKTEETGVPDRWIDYESEPLLKGVIPVCYEWDADSLKYVLSPDEVPDSVQRKLSTFGSVGELDLFNAFRSELDSVRATAIGARKDLIEYVYQRAEADRLRDE